MAVFSFDATEMEGIAPQSAQEQYLKRFGFTPPPLPDGYSHLTALEPAKPQQTNRITPPPSPRAQSQDFGSAANAAPGGEQVHTLVAKRKPKKRIQPTFASNIPSSSSNGINASSMFVSSSNASAARAPVSISSNIPISVPSTSALPLSVSQPFGTSSSSFGLGLNTGESSDFPMDLDREVRISSLETTGKGKRKAGDDFDERLGSKPRTLGGDRVRENISVRPLAGRAAPAPPVGGGTVMWAEGSALMGRLEPPQLVTYLKATIEGSEDLFEGRNAEGDGTCATLNVKEGDMLTCYLAVPAEPNEVLYVSGKQTQWLDYLPSPILAVTATPTFCAVAMQDGTLTVYSHTGRRYVAADLWPVEWRLIFNLE